VMKNKIKLFLSMLLFHLFVLNPTKSPLLNIEFLMQGVFANSVGVKLQFMFYHYILNLAFTVILIITVFQAISQTFEMRNYIITRCGNIKFKLIVLKVALKEIFAILIIKQIIYLLFFLYTKSFTLFYLYDMGSTFLTLFMFAQCFILFKLYGVKDKVPIFIIMGINMIAQMLSYEHHVFSIIVIASTEWKSLYLTNIIGKIVWILVFSGWIYLQKDYDIALGENE